MALLDRRVVARGTWEGDENVCLVIDGEVFASKAWPFSRADDWMPQVAKLAPEWRRFTVYAGRVDGAEFIGRPLCGAVRPKE